MTLTTVPFNFNEKMKDVIERYRNKSNDRDMEEHFYYDARYIKPSETVIEAGINHRSMILVIEKGI